MTNDDILKLARATLDVGLCFDMTARITRSTDAEILAFAKALLEKERGTEWQPIETAPKTGKKIIVRYLNQCGNARTVMARWLDDDRAAENDSEGAGLEKGWYECIDNWDDYTEVAIHEGVPTHWMPLPAAPQL